MDRRHYLESQRSHLSAHQGLPGTSFPSAHIRGRPPLSPILRSPLPHQSPPPLQSERFPAAVFPGRIQPHLGPIGQTSHHLLERQRELKEASLIQAKLAQQRAATHMLSSHVNHPVGEERVQYIPALQPNMTPEDSLAQLRRLHQQVLSMPSHDPQYFDMPSASLPSASRSREVNRDLQETAKLLRLSTQERMIMEQHMLNSKQQIAEQGGFAHVMEESLPCKSAGSVSPFVVPHQPSSPPVSRPTATRPPVLPCPNTISHEVNLRLQQKLATENSRRIQEMEKQQLQGDYSKHTALYPHKQKQIPSPNAVVIPHNIPQRSGHNYRSLIRPTFFKGIDSKPPLARPELRPELPHHNVLKQTIPQIKDVRSLKIETECGSFSRIDQRDVLLRMMEHRIKQELDKEDDSYSSSHMLGNRTTDEMQNSSMIKVPLSHSPSSTTPSTPDRPIKEEPLERSKQETLVPTDLSISSCQTSQILSVSENKSIRKRPVMADPPPSPITKRSRGTGDIFKARLADYNAIVTSSRPAGKDDPVSSSHVSTISETFCKQTSDDDSLDQPLDLSVPASQNIKNPEPELKQVSPVHREAKPLKSPSDQSQPCSRISMKTTTTISEIISEAVIASLDRPSTMLKNIGVPKCKSEEVTPVEEESIAKLQSSTSTRAEYVNRVSDSDAESSPACEEECQRQLIDVLSSQFAGSFRNFLVSLLRECKNDSIVKALAISKAGQRVPILMKEELERCNAKISQTIRTLLESDDEKGSSRMVKRNATNCEEGIEKDTSPPCQVSTTTDIWQHSPPVSPPGCISKAHGTVAKSQGDDSVKDLGNAKQFEQGNVPEEIKEGSGVTEAKDETKMPLIMKIESLASSPCDEEEISGANVALEVGDRDSISDVPLFIDDGFMNMSPPEGQTKKESGKPNVDQRKVEEDAIDLLKFGNDEIDLDENEVCEDKDQSQKEDLQFERTEDNPMLDLLESKPQSDEENSSLGKESSRPIHQTLNNDNSAGRTLAGETSNAIGKEVTLKTSVSSFSRCAINEGSSAMSAGKCAVSTSRVITNAAVGNSSTVVSGVSNCRMNAGAVQSKYQEILPKQSTTHTTVVASEQQTPLSIVSPPITIALPKVYQIDPVPSTQFLQIIPSPVTSNIVGPLATPVNGTPVPSVTISSLVPPGKETLMPTIQHTPSQASVIVSTVTSASSTNMKQMATSLASPTSAPSVGISHNASTTTSTSSFGSTYTLNGKVPIPPLSRVTPTGMKVNHGSAPLMWKGNALIPHNSPQETTNPKKPFVPAYTVVYHTAHLPCVVRSSVPFVPPKILWKSLFMSVTFTDFNKTLSICSILQRYMTVLEQAALQKDLTSNGISSCKLVPLDEFDSKYQDVEEQLAKISTGSVCKDNSHI